MTYEDAIASLGSLTNYEHARQPEAMRAITLKRMRSICQRLGDPQRRFRSVLVTGTNGKGSICAMLYSMLRESRLRVGLYTSPHVEHVRERIRVWTDGPTAAERRHGDDWIPEEPFAALVEQLQPALESLRTDIEGEAPTYFEAMTALAFLYFNQRRVEIAILEVGLGGRLDATNVVDQAISIIAPIAVDHAEILGSEPALIAREKAGIIKPRQTVLCAAQPAEVASVLQAVAQEQGVPLLTCGEVITVGVQHHDLDGLQLSITGLRGIYDSLTVPLLGRHQAQNAALAVGALEALSNAGAAHTIVEQGLAQVDWPGRIEVVSDAPLVFMDGAHNPHAANALAQTLTEFCYGRRIHLLIGLSSDKSVEAMGELLGPLAVSATCTTSRHPRAMDPAELARRLSPYCPEVHVMSDARDAYTYLFNAIAPEDVMVVTGSLFLVGALRAAIRISHVRPRLVATTA